MERATRVLTRDAALERLRQAYGAIPMPERRGA